MNARIRRDATSSLMLGFVFALTSAASAGVIHVDAGAPSGGDGASWTTAFDGLHDALAAAAPGDEVWVAAGVYRPAPSGGSRSVSFVLPSGAALYGGFAGGETSRDERDWIANETTLSGDLDGDDGPAFTNRGDNSLHVVTGADLAEPVIVDGFFVRGGYADSGSILDRSGGGMQLADLTATVANCTFGDNAAHRNGPAIYATGSDLTLTGLTVRGNGGLATSSISGGVGTNGSTLTASFCTFRDNRGSVGGGLNVNGGASTVISDCVFIGNYSFAGGGGAAVFNVPDLIFERTRFIGNDGGQGGGGAAVDVTTVTYRDCVFANNYTVFDSGGLVDGSTHCTVINTVFSRNSAGIAGGAAFTGQTLIVNSTFSGNEGHAIDTAFSSDVTIVNSILWGNVPEAIDPGASIASITFSDVEGGWPGAGNLDADPLFVQAGADDLRLATGSPCLDAGDRGAVPPGVETDIDGQPRIQGEAVDMGAYEGAFDPMPPSSLVEDFDTHDVAFLVPDGVGYDPVSYATVIIRNISGPEDATASATLFAGTVHEGAVGFSEVADVIRLETTLPDGTFRATVSIPFSAEDLGDVEATDVDGTSHDAFTGNWAVAVTANTVFSPEHASVFGDRITVVGSGESGYGTTLDIGDYGVFWNPAEQRGFVWANVDHAGDFGVGDALCPADAFQPPDGFVGVTDLFMVLASWGEGGGPSDVTGDGTVDVVDLLTVMARWGTCGG